MIKLKVLLVDDDEITNFLCKKMLSEIGVESVDSAINGQAALNYLKQNCPDIIFLDIKMPIMDGFEFLEELQEYPTYKQIKVVMLSSSSREKEKQLAIQFNNVIDFIVKPLTKIKATQVLNKFQ